MNTMRFIYTAVILSIIIAISSCAKKDSTNPDDNNDTGINPQITGYVISSGTPTQKSSVGISIVDINNQGLGITGASIQVNGLEVNDVGEGSYSLLITDNPVSEGTEVNIVVKIENKTYEASGIMPATGEQINIMFSGGAYSESMVNLANNE
ncbi:MAG: hypothetical protein KDC09_13580 [Bacteroidales bacterium]|nr:hypothetical protein [Bacteroidales bacterium]